MRIELTGLLQSAKGPYGGRANHLKLTTRQDRQVYVTHRKRAMTGDRVYAMHEWAKLQWTWIDIAWRALPQHVRALWGMCAKRRTDHARSNLDEFRAVNLPRAILGFPALRCPPDRFAAYATYLQRPKEFSRHTTTPPSQVWLHGDQKPEPRDPALPPLPPEEEPPEPQPFDWRSAEIPHPFIPCVNCVWQPCPDNAEHCYDELYLFMNTPWEQRPGHNFCRWRTPTYGWPPTRDPYWIREENIWSEQVWYDDVPYYEILHQDVRCYSGEWEDMTIPFPSAWCFRLQHISDPGVLLSYGYYWRDTQTDCPDGAYQLAKVQHVYGEFPWPDQVVLEPAGSRLTDAHPCPQPEAFAYDYPPISALWFDLHDDNRWAGLSWTLEVPHLATRDADACGGPAYVNASHIICATTGPLMGQWWFSVTVSHARAEHVLIYRKVAADLNPGVFGHYILFDPLNKRPWAVPIVMVYPAYTYWPDQVFKTQDLFNALVPILLAAILFNFLSYTVLGHLEMLTGIRVVYDLTSLRRSAATAQLIARELSTPSWKCAIVSQHAATAKTNYAIATEAIRRLRLLKHVIP